MKIPDSKLGLMLDRLARLTAADAWHEDLTPTQVTVLDYLNRANRFSRAPSQVADFLGATRGTVSQTLKTLDRKGLAREQQSSEDKRRISYELTEIGQIAIAGDRQIDTAIAALEPDLRDALLEGLASLLSQLLQRQNGRAFGLCKTCTYHRQTTNGDRHCTLLNVMLTAHEATQICHEQVPAA